MLTTTEIWASLTELAKQQGFYQRLCREIEDSGKKDLILSSWESEGFSDVVDPVMWLEDRMDSDILK